MKKPSIPAVNVVDYKVASLPRPMKENIETMTGVRGGPLPQLSDDADLPTVISTINAIIALLNA